MLALYDKIPLIHIFIEIKEFIHDSQVTLI